MKNEITLPAEVQEQISREAEQIYNDLDTAAREVDSYDFGLPMYYKQMGPIINALTGYATKLHETQQEVTRLTNWKQEAMAILNPLWDYAEENLDVQLGTSKTEAILKHINQAEELLVEVFQKHESGLLPDRFIYEKIKAFLYGEDKR